MLMSVDHTNIGLVRKIFFCLKTCLIIIIKLPFTAESSDKKGWQIRRGHMVGKVLSKSKVMENPDHICNLDDWYSPLYLFYQAFFTVGESWTLSDIWCGILCVCIYIWKKGSDLCNVFVEGSISDFVDTSWWLLLPTTVCFCVIIASHLRLCCY